MINLRLVAVIFVRAVAEVDGMCLKLVLVEFRSGVLIFVIGFPADGLHEARLQRAILCWTVCHVSVILLVIDVLLLFGPVLKRYVVVMLEPYVHEVRL